MEMGRPSSPGRSPMDSRCSTSTSGGRDGATTCARCQGIRGSPSTRSRSRPSAAILLKCLVAQHPSPSWLLSGTTSPARYDASPRRLGSRVHPEPAGARAADRGPAVTQRAESADTGRFSPARDGRAHLPRSGAGSCHGTSQGRCTKIAETLDGLRVLERHTPGKKIPSTEEAVRDQIAWYEGKDARRCRSVHLDGRPGWLLKARTRAVASLAELSSASSRTGLLTS